MNIDRMLIEDFMRDKMYLRFKYYGEFDTMKLIVDDCKDELQYIGNSSSDAAPIFIYTFKSIDVNMLKDFKLLNVYLRELRIRNITKKDLNKKEKSLLTFFNFFMNGDENFLIKGVSNYEIVPIIENIKGDEF